MQLRPATPEDVPAVLPMVAQLAALHEQWDPQRYDYRPDVLEMYRRWLAARAEDLHSVFLVAERQPGRLVGFLIGTIEATIPIYRLRQIGYIHDVWIEPGYRNQGLGRQLIMLAIEKFRQLGMKQVRLETAPANEAARAMFRSCGFRVSSIEMLVEIS